ncbi:MAG: hypothetical protein M3305_16825 [Actinomycetota bacterium]|nr:hypothetical protein [Actinomycetota bacterium]
MENPRIELPLPDEPDKLRARTRALIEDSPEEGNRIVNDARFLAGSLWEEWGAELVESDVGYERFLEITRGYASEIRLWVMGERPWDHCVAGLRGRMIRRLPDRCRKQETVFAGAGR